VPRPVSLTGTRVRTELTEEGEGMENNHGSHGRSRKLHGSHQR
jgi:hypothetical protein